MKNKIALASAFLAASSFSTAEIVINEFLSFEGFVDMSYSHTDQEIGAAQSNSNSYGLDQVEVVWLFDFDPVTAQIDFAHEGSDNGNQFTGVEQAFATYHMEGGAAFTAGRFSSMLGFEAFEPTGLYQYSFAYNDSEDLNSAFNIIAGGILPGYDQGVKYTYESDNTFFGISLVDGAVSPFQGAGRLGGGSGPFNFQGGSYAVEVAVAQDLGNGFSVFGGGRYTDGDSGGIVGVETQTVLNGYVTYETGAWVFAAELAYGEAEFPGAVADAEVTQGLLMANFAYSDAASLTGRVSFVDGDQGTGTGEDFTKYTVAHGYAFTDNLFLVNEISMVDGDFQNTDVEELHAAVELIFSF